MKYKKYSLSPRQSSTENLSQYQQCSRATQSMHSHSSSTPFSSSSGGFRKISPTDIQQLISSKRNLGNQKLKRLTQSEPPLRLANANWTKSDPDKGAMLATYLQCLSTKFLGPWFTFTQITPTRPVCRCCIRTKDIHNCVPQKIIPKKACGLDKIIGKMVKELLRVALMYLTQLFIRVIQLWELENIPEAGEDSLLTSSYPPISLLSIVSKRFERFLLAKLLPFLV